MHSKRRPRSLLTYVCLQRASHNVDLRGGFPKKPNLRETFDAAVLLVIFFFFLAAHAFAPVLCRVVKDYRLRVLCPYFLRQGIT